MSKEAEGVKGRVNHIDQHVGKKLKSRRLMLGMSQQELGEAVDVSIQQIQKYEKATNRVSSGKLYGLSRLLKVPVAYFFDGLDASNSNAMAEEQDLYQLTDATYNEVSEREVLSLVRAFHGVEEPKIRRKIVDLVRSLSSAAALALEEDESEE